MVDFVPGWAVIDAAQRKHGKYMTKCAAIGYGFLPFSFSSLRELEADAVTLLKRIRKFSMAQDIRARAAVHIFNRINFVTAKGIAAPKLMKKMADIYFTRVAKDAESSFSLSPRQMALWLSQRESNFGLGFVVVPIQGSSPLTRTGMTDFAPGRVVIDAAQRKRGKYLDKCAAIGYGFLPFSFSSLGELEANAVTLLKRIRKFPWFKTLGARATIHIFIDSFAIAKRVGLNCISAPIPNV
ncbi:hypothetical protein Tco_1255592 [Tanacetum coccineum]